MHKIIIAMLLFYSSIAISQNCNSTLTGKIIDLHDGTVLTGATIVVVENNFTTLSNIEGKYSISNLYHHNFF